MANTDKMITETVLKDVTEKILQTIADKIYDLVPYDSTEISEILEISDEEAMELTKIISDNIISTNKIWSSNKTNTEIQNAIIEANKYADELIGQISSISLEYVTALPTSDIKSNVIYILQGTPNTLNVYNTSTSAFVTVGDLDLDLSQYYTKSDVDTLLADKADDNTVVHQDDVVTDMTTTSGTTVLSTSGLKTELDKKANDDEVVKTTDIVADLSTTSASTTLSTAGLQTELDKKANDDEVLKPTDITTTIESASTDTQVPSAKAVSDKLQEYRLKSKVADVPQTPITFSDTTNYEAKATSIYSNYEVADGICYVLIYAKCLAPSNSWISINNSLPRPKRFVFKSLSALDKATDSLNCTINIGGNMSLRGGTANGEYITTFSYHVAE